MTQLIPTFRYSTLNLVIIKLKLDQPYIYKALNLAIKPNAKIHMNKILVPKLMKIPLV